MRAPERLFISYLNAETLATDGYGRINVETCRVESTPIEYVRADLVESPWVPVSELTDQLKKADILDVSCKYTDERKGREYGCYCPLRGLISISSGYHLLYATHVRLPSKGPA